MKLVHGIALCVPDEHESEILQALADGPRHLSVVRRCADVAELYAVAASGVAELAIVVGDDPDIDARFCEELHRHGMKCLLIRVIHPDLDTIGAHYYYSLGIDRVIDGFEPQTIIDELSALTLNRPNEPLPLKSEVSDPFEEIVASQEALRGHTHLPNYHSSYTSRDLHTLDGDGTGLETARQYDVGEAQYHEGASSTDNAQAPSFGSKQPASDKCDEVAWYDNPLGFVDTSESREPRGLVIAVYGTSGAPGRSAVAIHTAAELASGARVIVLDADLCAPSVAHSLGLNVDGSSLSALARMQARGALTLAHIDEALYPGPAGMSIITGLSSPHRWREASPSALASIVDVCRKGWDYIIVDVHAASFDPVDEFHRSLPHRDTALTEVLRQADGILVVGRADAVGLHRFTQAWEWLESIDTQALKIVAINMAQEERTGRHPQQAIAEALRSTIPGQTISVIPFDERVLTALLRGTTVRGSYKRSARGAFRDLAYRIHTEVPRLGASYVEHSSSV